MHMDRGAVLPKVMLKSLCAGGLKDKSDQNAYRDNLQGCPYRDNYPCGEIPVGVVPVGCWMCWQR